MAAGSDATPASPTVVAGAKRMVGALAMLFSLTALTLVSFADERGRLAPSATSREAKAMIRVDVVETAVEAAAPVKAPGAATRLMGSSSSAVVDVLGPATFARQEGRAQLWRYAGELCVLFVFLHAADGVDRVEHLESRAAEATRAVSLEDCVASLQRARAVLAQAR